MLAIRPGSVGPLRCLEDLLRERWEDARQAVLEEIKQRQATDVPLDDLKDPGEYSPLGYEGIHVRLRTLRNADVQAFSVRFKPLSEVKTVEDVAQEADSIEAARVFLSKAVAELRGLEDESGPVTLQADAELCHEDLDLIEGAGLAFLFNLLHAARVWQHLPAEARKNSGGSHELTSESSSAASAKSKREKSEDVTGELVPLGTGGPNTSQTPVPVAS